MAEDRAEAVQWYRRAAKQGHAVAQFNLGACYANGKGVPEDDVQAYAWFNLSAAQGIEEAAEARDECASSMTRRQVAQAQHLSRTLHREIERRRKATPAR